MPISSKDLNTETIKWSVFNSYWSPETTMNFIVDTADITLPVTVAASILNTGCHCFPHLLCCCYRILPFENLKLPHQYYHIPHYRFIWHNTHQKSPPPSPLFCCCCVWLVRPFITLPPLHYWHHNFTDHYWLQYNWGWYIFTTPNLLMLLNLTFNLPPVSQTPTKTNIVVITKAIVTPNLWHSYKWKFQLSCIS